MQRPSHHHIPEHEKDMKPANERNQDQQLATGLQRLISHGNRGCSRPVGISYNKVIGRNAEAIAPFVVCSLSGTLDGREYFRTDFLQIHYYHHMGIDFAQRRFVSHTIR